MRQPNLKRTLILMHSLPKSMDSFMIHAKSVTLPFWSARFFTLLIMTCKLITHSILKSGGLFVGRERIFSSIMLEEADEKSANMLPSLNEESSMLRRFIGANGTNSTNNSFGRKLSWRRRKMNLAESIIQAEQAAIDAVLDPDSTKEMPAVFAVQKEPRSRSSRVANLQKLRTELPQQPTPQEFYNKTNTIISVKEAKQNAQQEETSGAMARGKDNRPLKSVHWKDLEQRHNCEGNSSNCEKCKRVLEVKKATKRFEAKRAAKKIMNESNSTANAGDGEEDHELGNTIQKIKREERFCSNGSAPNARIVAQKSKTVQGGDVSWGLIGANSKWAQPVLSQMPKEVYKGRSVDYSTRSSTPRPAEEEFKIERSERKIISCVSRLKLVREYLDDEPDFESEVITSIGPRSQADVMFTLPGVPEGKFAKPSALQPNIQLIDMSPLEYDVVTSHAEQAESRATGTVSKFIQNMLTVTELIGTGRAEWDGWHELEEKEKVSFESDSEGRLFQLVR